MKHIKTYESIQTQEDIDNQLAIAVHRDKIDSVKYAIKLGANPNKKDSTDTHLLFVAITNNNVEIVRELLKAGANADIKNYFGNTPLILVARDRFTRNKVRSGYDFDKYEENILEELIMAGADWNLKNIDGEDFFDFLIDYFRQPLREKYPEKYKEYIMKKDADKYNL